MAELDKPRLTRIAGEWLEATDMVMQEMLSDGAYTAPESFLEDYSSHEADKLAVQGLQEYLENDCE